MTRTEFMKAWQERIMEQLKKNLEVVSHPLHYNVGKYEVIDVIEDQGWGEGFNRGNALKYIMRAKHKNADKEIEDLEKAAWYINREIERLSQQTDTISKYQFNTVSTSPHHGGFIYNVNRKTYPSPYHALLSHH